MHLRTRTWFLLSVLLFVAAIGFWLYGDKRQAAMNDRSVPARTNEAGSASPASGPFNLLSSAIAQRVGTAVPKTAVTVATSASVVIPKDTNFPHRLRNTSRSIGELVRSETAVLLRNAFIDTAEPQGMDVPENLRSDGDPGSYIVQARGPITERFRAMLAAVGAETISYIPNNAYLVRASTAVARRLSQTQEIQSILAYEPYYKLDPALLAIAVEGQTLPDDGLLRVTLFPREREAAIAGIASLGAELLVEEPSPFGDQLVIRPPADVLVTLARMTAVQGIERVVRRTPASDRSRVRVGISPDSIGTTNYLQLTGNRVIVSVNDEGVDANHVALAGRVISPDPLLARDTGGHGTHVASIIAGNGEGSITSTPPGSETNANFRGMAPKAQILSLSISYDPQPNGWLTDTFLQETPAKTNYVLRRSINAPMISNNSWNYAGLNEYDSAAARFDATVRDALPGVERSQPMIFVFAAGNSGEGSDNGLGAIPNSISSPATAKNVITVGAIESLRSVTNIAVITNITEILAPDGGVTNLITLVTNTPFQGMTDSDYEVAAFSSRGNVGIGTEGTYGRFKPDVMAPGAFIIGARSGYWDEARSLDPADGKSQVIQEVNKSVAPNYRFESGTSQATPVVSGMLALMQEFFEQRIFAGGRRTNSPAMMKALLINGARSLGGPYDLQLNNSINHQGWGQVNLTNSIPAMLGANQPEAQWPIRMFDQSPANAVATGEARSWRIALSTNAQQVPFRATLVWTDPPGNPNAAVKLVNDLDLIISNTVTHVAYYGNNIPAQSDYSVATETNSVSQTDVVNNVENVFLRDPGGSNLVVTVVGRRVNVNAVSEFYQTTARVNDVVQDYALVISLGDTTITNGMTIALPTTRQVVPPPEATTITNGIPIFNQRVGANPTLIPGVNGLAAQWNFYTFTNTFLTNSASTLTNGTNVAFITFRPPNISVPRSSLEADIDLYVSKDPGLLTLNANAVAGARKSIKRGGTESIVYTDAQLGEIFYVGVKSEDQQGGEYGLVVISSNDPFEENQGGSRVLRGFPARAVIPDGVANLPGAVQIFAVGISPQPIYNVIATNLLTHQDLGDLIGILSHDSKSVALNNHNLNNGILDVFGGLFVYDDSYLGSLFGRLGSDGPGKLTDFAGERGDGVWIFNMIDSAPTHTGRVESLTLRVDPFAFGDDLAAAGLKGIDFKLAPFGESCGVQEVPPGVTNMIFRATKLTGPVDLYIRRDSMPTAGEFDKVVRIDAPAGEVSLGIYDQPPLVPGRYFYCLRNPSEIPVNGNLALLFEFDVNLDTGRNLSITNEVSLLDSGTISSSVFMNADKEVNSVEVGVRIQHPRPSDLVLHLISPQGTRLLLAENRGGKTDQGYGSGESTNVTYTLFTEDTNHANPLLPVKFTMAPFTNTFVGTNPPAFVDGFEKAALGVYGPGSNVSGWNVITNQLKIHDDLSIAGVAPDSGFQFAELLGSIEEPAGIVREFPTQPSAYYLINLAIRRYQTNVSGPEAIQITYGEPAPGVPENRYLYLASTNWQSESILFQATGTNSFLKLQSVYPSGIFVDSVRVLDLGVPATAFVMPEESFSTFKGERAMGEWRLEVTDTRFGPVPRGDQRLVKWRLHLEYADPVQRAIMLTNGVIFSGSLTNAQTNYFTVDICDQTTVATAFLRGNFDSLTLLADREGLPTGDTGTDDIKSFNNDNPFDEESGDGFATLFLNARTVHPVPLKQGRRLFFAVHNARSGETNEYSFHVILDAGDCNPRPIIRLRDNIAYTNAIPPLDGIIDYFVYRVSPIAEKVDLELKPLNGDVGLILSRGLPLPTLTNFAYQVDAPGITNEFISLTTKSAPVPLTPGDWHIGVYSHATNTVIYSILATPTLNTNINLIRLTNGVPVEFTVAAGMQITNFFVFPVEEELQGLHFDVDRMSTGSNLHIAVDQLPPTTNSLVFSGASNAPIFTSIRPVDVRATSYNGDWFAAIQPLAQTDISFRITARALSMTETNLVDFRREQTNSQSCVYYPSEKGKQYVIQGKRDPNDEKWVQISPVITALQDGESSFCVDLALGYEFFQVARYRPATPPPATGGGFVDSTIVVANETEICVGWTATVGSTYYVQGSDAIEPAQWANLSTNKAAQANMNVCFPRTGAARFFRVAVVGGGTVPPPVTGGFVDSSLAVSTADICVSWASQVGTTYYVQGTMDIEPAQWTNLSTNTATQLTTTACMPNTIPQRFFRVAVVGAVVQPPPAGGTFVLPTLTVGSEVCVSWTAAVGATYEVQGSIDIEPANWLTISTNKAAQANASACIPRTTPYRFFRVGVSGAATGGASIGTSSPVQLSNPTLAADGALRFEWAAVIGRKYEVQFTGDLGSGTWTSLTNVTAATDQLSFTESAPRPDLPRFYRIISR